MNSFAYYANMDSHPGTGQHNVDFNAKLSEKPHLDGFFNGNRNYEQITGVTRGKIYRIHAVELIGDAVDLKFLNDNSQEQTLGIFFFEDPTKEG